MLVSSDVIAKSGVAFGTSGARGLVTQFTPDVCAAFAHSFLSVMKRGFDFHQVAIAIDNRPSSYAMAMACAKAMQQQGIRVLYYGVIPTPALAYVAMQAQIPCLMVTGSHIPFDRNGLKFYRPDGEISKADEQAILAEESHFEAVTDLPELEVLPEAAQAYVKRYTSLFDANLLSGKKIGIYEHSSAGRELYAELFASLGAEVVALERSDEFVPIDTEAVSDEDKAKAIAWSSEYQLDALFSTDGDGDRPLVSDEKGNWLRGDILGLLCAKVIGVEALAVPVSCNTAIEASGAFKHIERTRIGSPYVIAEFAELSAQYATVAGFEANGGFLLGTDAAVNGKTLKALPTRDAVLPALMLLAAAKEAPISQLVNALPRRFTYSDRIKEFPTERSKPILAKAAAQPEQLLQQLGFNQGLQQVDTTDGLRMTLTNGTVVHLRPSGNAPELRCYAEAADESTARSCVEQALGAIRQVAI